MLSTLSEILAGPFTFTAHLWTKDGHEHDIELPGHLGFQAVAQALREHHGAQSAQVYALNPQVTRSPASFSTRWTDGGSVSYHEFSPSDALRHWTRHESRLGTELGEVELKRWEGGKVTGRMHLTSKK